MALVVTDPDMGLSPRDVYEMPIGLVWQTVALVEQRARMRAAAGSTNAR